MKLLAIAGLCMVLIAFDCASKNDKKSINKKMQKSNVEEKSEKVEKQAEKSMSEFLSFENTQDGIEYKFKAEIKKAGNYQGIEYINDFVEIEYELNNTTEKDYLVFNRGHFGTNSNTVYVEPTKDGRVEISQRAFDEPTDRNCPDRFVAITPKASLMKAKAKITEKIQVELPLKTQTPFDDCEPKPEVPNDVKEVKFCIGVIEADTDGIKLTDDGQVRGLMSLEKQKLLCSDSVNLK